MLFQLLRKLVDNKQSLEAGFFPAALLTMIFVQNWEVICKICPSRKKSDIDAM